MKIRTIWESSGNNAEMPWLVEAVDEYTIEEWNGLPEFYLKELNSHVDVRRELIIDIPDTAVRRLFAVPTVAAKPNGGG